jgi:hypothetical protein
MEENKELKVRVKAFLKERRNRILRGEINSIPSPFIRFRDDFVGIEQAKYYVVTSSTKGGKTQLSSFLFVYNTLLYAYTHPTQCSVKIFYYPLEETPEDVMTRFMSYLLYTLSNSRIRISPTNLTSTDNDKPVDEDVLKLLDTEEYDNILEFFQNNIIFSDSTNPTGVYAECKSYAEMHGTVHHKKKKVKDSFTNETKEIEGFNYYESDNPNEYRIIFYDHVSLTSTERGMTLKQSIDKLSEYMVLLRNRYKFTPVVIQQQAFVGEGLDAYKENKIRPTIANLADSKYPSRDCNVCLGLFSPFKFELKEYMGYDISKFRDNIRFMELLINRGGTPGGMIALFFDGATCSFNELPTPKDTANIYKVYTYLKSIRGKNSVLMFIHSKLNNNKLLDKIEKSSIFASLFGKFINREQ